MDLWHGAIQFDEGESYIQGCDLLNHAINKVLTSPRTDLHFSHPDRALPFLTHHTSLKYLTIVETANVPLFLVVGPSLDVWTDNESTEQWIRRCLFDDLKDGDEHLNGWWDRIGGQSQNSILLGVRGGADAGEGSASEITEILLYAGTSQELNAPPTPPTSSPLEHGDHGSKTSLNVRIHALPLSSKIYNTLAQTPSIPHINPASDDQEFYYLPSPPPAQSHQHDDNPATKRPHIESLFDEATQIRRLHKKQGGEGIAKAMAAMDARMSMPALSSTTAALPEPLINPNLKAQPKPRTPFSRASTTGCINPPPQPQTNDLSSRPPSSHLPPLPKRRRSSLARSPCLPSPSIDTERPASDIPDNTSAIEHQNKTTLSRIIMAGMRMHGLQPQHQRRKSVGGASYTQNPASASTDARERICGGNGEGGQDSVWKITEDEYKAIYHQTFKSTTFTFRNTWKTSAIKEESLRDTANIFLSQFCTPPNQHV